MDDDVDLVEHDHYAIAAWHAKSIQRYDDAAAKNDDDDQRFTTAITTRLQAKHG